MARPDNTGGRMKQLTTEQMVRWGALWHSNNKLDGVTEHLCCDDLLPALFLSRRKCREWIKTKYGYIKTRKDLRAEPHGWSVPRPVRVMFLIQEDK